MTKRKRQQPTVEEILERPWCFYCERDFDDLKILISHQKAKHYKCSLCSRRLNTAGGLSVHMAQVHKETLTHIENSLPNRKDVNIEIFGMEGIPEDLLNAHKQRITAEYFKMVAERRAESGNPPENPPGTGAQLNKKPKFETPEEIKARLAEHKAKREAERLARAGGDRGSITPGSRSGPFATPGTADGQSHGSPDPMDLGQGSPFTAQSPFPGHGMPPGPPPLMSPSGHFFNHPIPSPMGPGSPFGLPPHMPPPMPGNMPPHLPPPLPGNMSPHLPPHLPPHIMPPGMPMFPGGPPPFPPPPFHPMQQHNMPRPGGPPFANGHQHSPGPQTQPKPAADLLKQQSSLDLDVPGLPARPTTNAPNLNREDMARLHAGAPARQVSTSQAAPASATSATDDSANPAAAGTLIDESANTAAAENSIDDSANTAAVGTSTEELIESVSESKPDASVPAVHNKTHNDATTSTAPVQTNDQAAVAPYTTDKLQAALPSDAAGAKIPKAISTKKGGKKSSKGADRETRLVYTDKTMSPEEKRAALPRYTFKRDESTTYVQGDAGPAVTGPVRGSDDIMDTQATH